MIYVDMDGVVANFAIGVQAWLNYGSLRKGIKIDNSRFDLGLDTGTWEAFWRWESTQLKFWYSLGLLEPGARLIKFLDSKVGRDGWRFCTSHGKSFRAAWGKAQFAHKYFAVDPDHIIFCVEKHRLSLPGTLLIDDRDENVDDFYNKGYGMSILWPQPWNRAKGQSYANAMTGISKILQTPELMKREING